MRLGAPWWLLAVPAVLVVLPALFWLHDHARRRRLGRFAASPTLAVIAPERRAAPVLARRALLVGAAASLAVALARPQWGAGDEVVRRRGLDVAFLLDLSESMLAPASEGATDSRLGAARRAVTDLLTMLRGDRHALVVFAGDAQVLCPLTVDDGALRLFLDLAGTDLPAVPGSDIGLGIDKALEVFPGRERKFKAIVLLSDGEDLEGRGVAAARRAAAAGVLVHAIGFGAPAGEPIPVTDEAGGARGYKKDAAGGIVSTRLDEATLGALAEAAGGVYAPARAGDRALRAVADAVDAMERREIEGKIDARYRDRVEWPAGVALALLALEAALGLGLRGKRARALAAAAPTPERGARSGQRGAAVVAGLLTMLLAGPAVAESAAVAAERAFRDKDYERAAELFRSALVEEPGLAELHYNLGTSLLHAGESEPAAAEFGQAIASGDDEVKAHAHYNLGTSLLAAGKLEEAAAELRKALRLLSGDADVKFNYELARRLLETSPPPQPSPSPQPQQEEPQPSPGGSPEPQASPEPTPGAEPSPDPDESGEEPTPTPGPGAPRDLTEEQAEQLLDALAAEEAADRKDEDRRPPRERRPGRDW